MGDGQQLADTLCANSLIYKKSLERIISKYSHLPMEDGGTEIDVFNVSQRDYMRHLKLSERELSERCADLKEQSSIVSVPRQDITRDTQWQDTFQDKSEHSTVEHDELSAGDDTQLKLGSMNETERSLLESPQPEDYDTELERALSSQSSSLLEQYPIAVQRIGRALHRESVSRAADSVRRRYLRLQGKFKGGDHSHNQTIRRSSKVFNKNRNQSPGKVENSVKTAQNQPVLVIDSHFPLTETERFEPDDTQLNKTFTVSEEPPLSSTSPQQREQHSTLLYSPARPCLASTNGVAMHPSLRLGQTGFTLASCPLPNIITSEGPPSSVAETLVGLCSPNRKSPLKRQNWEDRVGSPHILLRSTKLDSEDRPPKDGEALGSVSASPAFLLQKLQISPRKLHSLQPHCPSKSQFSYSQAPTWAIQHKLQRLSSFDSSLKLRHKGTADPEFQKYYHRFVCQGKTSLTNVTPCHKCARSSEMNRGHFSQYLAALALSPHRPGPRKRNRELEQDGSLQSKRSRDWDCVHSPGSLRYGIEMLRHQYDNSKNLSPSTKKEASADYLTYSPSKASVPQTFSIQKPSSESQQRKWMLQDRHGSDIFGLDEDRSPQSKRSRDWDCAYSPGSIRYHREMLRHQYRNSRNLSPAKEMEPSIDYLTYSPNKASGPRTFRVLKPSSGGRTVQVRLASRFSSLDEDRSPQSKRSRDWDCAYSPGSLRYHREMLRRQYRNSRNFSPSKEMEASSDYLTYSHNKASVRQTFSVQKPSSGRRTAQVRLASRFSSLGENC